MVIENREEEMSSYTPLPPPSEPNFPEANYIDTAEERERLLEYHSLVEEAYPYESYNKHFEEMGFNTRAIHCGNPPEAATGAVNPPIYMSSTFALKHPRLTKGYIYSRNDNPSYKTPEYQIASLEGGKYAMVFGSGISSLASIAMELLPGEKLICFTSCYSGTFKLLDKFLRRFQVDTIFVSINDMEMLEKKLREKPSPKYLFFESPTNPRMDMCDIAYVCKLCKENGVLTLFDNTFSTPYCLKPLSFGVDVVVHSTTKFLNGHSDILGGVMITNNQELYKKAHFNRLNLGMLPSPFDSWLLARSLKSFPIRIERHCFNALKFAQHFENHPLVNEVFYPGLKSHKYHQLASQQLSNGFGGIMSIDLKVHGLKGMFSFCDNLKIFVTAISLGGIESLVNHSTTMTHLAIPSDIKQNVGITDTLLRVSIGLENVEDLIQDFEQALKTSIKLHS